MSGSSSIPKVSSKPSLLETLLAPFTPRCSSSEDVRPPWQQAGRGASPDAGALEPAWSSKLCDAAARGSIDELKELVNMGAPVDEGDYDKRTAIHLAASEGMLEVVRFLVDELSANHSPLDRWGNTPLDDAIRSSHFAVADYLSSRGAAKTVTKQVKEGGGSAPEPLGEPNA